MGRNEYAWDGQNRTKAFDLRCDESRKRFIGGEEAALEGSALGWKFCRADRGN
jgi:hypothetical protein